MEVLPSSSLPTCCSALALAALSAACRGLTVSPEKYLGANGLTSGLRPAAGAEPPPPSLNEHGGAGGGGGL